MKTIFRVWVKGDSPSVWFDFPADGVNLPNFITGCRLQGFVLHDTFYVPWTEVKHISVVQIGMPNTVGSETRQ